jgi:hypothetical protein
MIPEPLHFNGNDLNNALLRDPALKLVFFAEKSAPNHLGIYHDTYRPDDASRSLHCYYLCDPDHKECVKSPPIGKAWYDTIPELIDKIEALELASRKKEQRQFLADMIDLVCKANALVNEKDKLENERETKKRHLIESIYSGNSTNNSQGEAHDGSNGVDGAMETNLQPRNKQCPGPCLLNLHQDTVFGGMQQRH